MSRTLLVTALLLTNQYPPYCSWSFGKNIISCIRYFIMRQLDKFPNTSSSSRRQAPVYTRHAAQFNHLWTRYNAHPEDALLQEVISAGDETIKMAESSSLVPSDVLVDLLRNLAAAYSARYDVLHREEDIDRAIALRKQIIAHFHPHDTECADDEAALCSSYALKFSNVKDINLVNEAIFWGRSAINRLQAIGAGARVGTKGGRLSLGQASYQAANRRAQRLQRSASLSRALSGLGYAFQARFFRFHAGEDLQTALEFYTAATLEGENAGWSPSELVLSQTQLALAMATALAFVETPLQVADEYIRKMKDALKHCPPGSPSDIRVRQCLSQLYYNRSFLSKSSKDLKKAIEYLKTAHEEDSDLAILDMMQYQLTNNLDDIKRLAELGTDAAERYVNVDISVSSRVPLALMAPMVEQYEATHDNHYLEEALKYGAQLNYDLLSLPERTANADYMARLLHKAERYEAAVKYYWHAVRLLPEYFATGKSYGLMNMSVEWETLATRGAACALAGNDPATAVSILELGRSVGWKRSLQLRTDFEQLLADQPKYAKKLKKLGLQMEKADLSLAGGAVESRKAQFGLEDAMWEKRLNWSLQRNNLIDDIRGLPGHEDFLAEPSYADLWAASSQGPVVVINVNQYRSDALILVHATPDRPQVVPLSNYLEDLMLEWNTSLREGTEKLESGGIDEAQFQRIVLGPIMRGLWKEIVSPIRDALKAIAPYAARIWWCPTGQLTFLPIHVVTNGIPGVKKTKGSTMQNLVPSYTTTLMSLVQARKIRPKAAPKPSIVSRMSGYLLFMLGLPCRPLLRISGASTVMTGQSATLKPTAKEDLRSTDSSAPDSRSSRRTSIARISSTAPVQQHTLMRGCLIALSFPFHAISQLTQMGLSILLYPFRYLPVGLRRNNQAATINLLAVSCVQASGFDDLPGTHQEILSLKKIGQDYSVRTLINSKATTGKVLSLLSTHDWLHLACHGIQSISDPYRSYFQFSNGPLYLSDVMAKRLNRAEFAFLSACHTASGIPAVSDEAMHLAAALHFIGFRSTIATMWAVDDGVAPKLAAHVYDRLFRDSSRRPNAEDAAEALAFAVKTLRKEGVPISKLAPFIHIGV